MILSLYIFQDITENKSFVFLIVKGIRQVID